MENPLDISDTQTELENQTLQTQNPLDQKPKKNYKKIFFKLLIALAILVPSIFVIYIIYMVGITVIDFNGSTNTCHEGGRQLFGRTDEIKKEFDSIEFVPGQSDIKSKVSKSEGDCLDSIPTINLEKTYKNPTMNAGELFDHLTTTLKSKGYNTAYDPSRENICFGVTYYDDGEDYSDHEDREIRISIECLGSFNEKKANWRSMNVGELSVQGSIRWRYSESK